MKNKKGVSIMIGYVLLITIAVIMGGVMYTWMKSYVPTEEIKCPEGVSIIVTDYYYNCSNTTLNITLKNNGRFDIAGYYIKATNDPSQSLAVLDLSKLVLKTNENITKYANSVIFGSGSTNTFAPGEITENVFNVNSISGEVESIEIIPIRWQRDDKSKLRFVGCGDATKFRESIDCN